MEPFKKKTVSGKNSTNSDVLVMLNDMFQHILHPDIIKSVAQSQQWNVKSTCDILSQMIDNAVVMDNTNKQKAKQTAPLNTVAYGYEVDADDVDVLVESSNGLSKERARSKKQQDIGHLCSEVMTGSKVMVLMRGLPGSGKSHMACAIVRCTLGDHLNSGEFVFSTDDYFFNRGRYKFNSMLLSEAHAWNQKRVLEAAKRGVSPIIVDNTNTQTWEMRSYAMIAVQFAYQVELLEPDTPWAWHVPELVRRNQHQVPRQRIADMAQRYERNITVDRLFAVYGLQYSPGKSPPQKRLYPPCNISQERKRVHKHRPPSKARVKSLQDGTSVLQHNIESAAVEESDTWESDTEGTWEVVQSPPLVQDLISFSESPLKKIELCDVQAGLKLLKLQDGTIHDNKNSFEFPKLNFDSLSLGDVWANPQAAALPTQGKYSQELIANMELKEMGTNTSSTDFKQNGELAEEVKVLFGKARDINNATHTKFWKPPPKILMLHKGTMTGLEDIIYNEMQIKKKEHLDMLINLFPAVEGDILEDILDKCQGDVNWAVDLLLESSGGSLELRADAINCTYTDNTLIAPTALNVVSPCADLMLDVNTTPKPARSRSKPIVDESIKRHIEEQFKIADEHYSKHLLNLRKKRHGEIEVIEEPGPSSSYTPRQSNKEEQQESDEEKQESDEDEQESDREEYKQEDDEELVELRLGEELVCQLERHFGMTDDAAELPSGFQPVIQVPISLARQLHALWLQSLCTQMVAQNSILEEVERQDKQLALQLQQRERELGQEKHKPVPNLQEIMDMEIALAVYNADQQMWQQETPQDMASRMTRQKLYDAFPNLEKRLLDEILQAHDNCFEQTVNSLICSLGHEEDNLMNGGEQLLARQRQLLETARKAGAEENEALEEDEEGYTVKRNADYYREQAAHHLRMREQLYRKAQESVQKGLPQVGSYYSEVAKLYMQKYELANSRAACAFLNEHSAASRDSHTIDLHYLYVREAEQALAVFLDAQISRLQESGKSNDALFVVTGRGKRSVDGVSHIKPAVQRRLKQRKLRFTQVNPGLLKVIITRHSILTNDIKHG